MNSSYPAKLKCPVSLVEMEKVVIDGEEVDVSHKGFWFDGIGTGDLVQPELIKILKSKEGFLTSLLRAHMPVKILEDSAQTFGLKGDIINASSRLGSLNPADPSFKHEATKLLDLLNRLG